MFKDCTDEHVKNTRHKDERWPAAGRTMVRRRIIRVDSGVRITIVVVKVTRNTHTPVIVHSLIIRV